MKKNMKALVIENESEVPGEVLLFCHNGLDTGLFWEVEFHINSRNESLLDLLPVIIEADCIVVKSTWMYKDQLEQFVGYFANSTKQYTFYVWDFCKWANDWLTKPESFSSIVFFDKLRKLVQNHHVISVEGNKLYSVFNHTNGKFVKLHSSVTA